MTYFFFAVLLVLLFFCTGVFGYILLAICALVFLCAILPDFFWIILATSVIGVVLYYYSTRKDRENQAVKNKLKKQREEERRLFKTQLAELIEKYGECSGNINLGNWDEHTLQKRLLVFKKSNIVIINGIEYEFSDIIRYSANNDTTYDYSAKKTIWKNRICIHTKSSEKPTIILKVYGNREKAYTITSILNMIINKNKKQYRQLRKQK